MFTHPHMVWCEASDEVTAGMLQTSGLLLRYPSWSREVRRCGTTGQEHKPGGKAASKAVVGALVDGLQMNTSCRR